MPPKKSSSRAKPKKSSTRATGRAAAAQRPFPRRPLGDALQIPNALKEFNGGNPWAPTEVAAALDMGSGNSSTFFYLTAASRDFQLTVGTRDTAQIELTEFGRSLAYAANKGEEERLLRQAFLNVELFRRVVDYYKGTGLPETKYVSNTLSSEFGLDPAVHDEFLEVFKTSAEFAGIGATSSTKELVAGDPLGSGPSARPNVVTLEEPDNADAPHCFVVMPFTERSDNPDGFFDEVLKSVIAPAGKKAGFVVTTANRDGTDVIQSTIVNNLLDADLVVADLTEHNPNVLFELGMRMAFDKPVVLIRAKGTGQIFDVDNMLRVYDYDPNLWPSSVERDVPDLTTFIRATWNNRTTENTFLRILRRTPAEV